jgi:hypothetical protein
MSDDQKTSWRVHVDMTTICIILALCLGGYFLKQYLNKIHNDEVVAVERARLEAKLRQEEDERKADELRLAAKLDREKEAAERKQASLENDLRNNAVSEIRKKAKEAELARKKEEFDAALKLEDERRAAQTAALLEAQADAIRKRKEGEAAAKANDVNALKQTIVTADKEIAEATAQLDPMASKMVAYKNVMAGAMKKNETLQKNLKSLGAANGTQSSVDSSKNITNSGRTAGNSATTTIGYDLSDEIIKQAGKQESVGKEFRDAANGYAQLTADRDRLEGVIKDAKLRKESALAALKQMGVAVEAAKPAVVVAAPKEQPKGGNKIYIMKDGKKYVSTKSIEAGDTVSIKLENGKFEALNKDEIEKVIDE